MILLLIQVSWLGRLGNTLDYLAQIEPPAITIEVFPRNENDRTRFSRLRCKRSPPNGQAVGHPWLLFLAWKNIIFCYYCKLFSSGYPLAQHSISPISGGTTLVPLFWSGRYLAREEVLMRVVILWFIAFNGAIDWSLCWRGLGITLSGLAFVTWLMSVITPWCTPSKISTRHWVGPSKSVLNRARHLLTPALIVVANDVGVVKINPSIWIGLLLTADWRVVWNSMLL